MSEENKKERKVIKVYLDELNNVSGGDTYTEFTSEGMEIWYICGLCRKNKQMIWSQKGNGSDSSHGTSHIVMKCPYCGYEEEFYFGW